MYHTDRFHVPEHQQHRKKVSFDHIRHCIQNMQYTSNNYMFRLHSTFQVIRACMCILWSVLEVTRTTNMYHKDRFHVPDKVKHWKKRAFDRIGNVSQTYKKKMKKIARINSTPHVIQACLCTIRSILQVTQRVPPTCITNTDFTYRFKNVQDEKRE